MNNNNNPQVLLIYLTGLSHLFRRTALLYKHHYPHFTNEVVKRLNNLKVITERMYQTQDLNLGHLMSNSTPFTP